jgi:hypothetical protein
MFQPGDWRAFAARGEAEKRFDSADVCTFEIYDGA